MPNYMLPAPGYWSRQTHRTKHRRRVRHRIGARCTYHARPDEDEYTHESFGGYPSRSETACTVVGGENAPRDYVVEFEDCFRGLVYGEELKGMPI